MKYDSVRYYVLQAESSFQIFSAVSDFVLGVGCRHAESSGTRRKTSCWYQPWFKIDLFIVPKFQVAIGHAKTQEIM